MADLCILLRSRDHGGRLDWMLNHLGCALSLAFMSISTSHWSAGWPLERPGQILVFLRWIVRRRSVELV